MLEESFRQSNWSEVTKYRRIQPQSGWERFQQAQLEAGDPIMQAIVDSYNRRIMGIDGDPARWISREPPTTHEPVLASTQMSAEQFERVRRVLTPTNVSDIRDFLPAPLNLGR